MKIVVIGSSGRIGSNVVNRLRQGGHAIVAASPRTGVDHLTGEGLTESLIGAQVVVDVANSRHSKTGPYWNSSKRRAGIFLSLKR